MLSSVASPRPFTSSQARHAVPKARGSLTVPMAKPTKAADFRGLSNEEVLSKINELKVELARTRWLQKTRGISELKAGQTQQPDPDAIPKSHLNKYLRTQVAQLWTILRQRQIEDGLNRRTSRKLENKWKVVNGLERLP